MERHWAPTEFCLKKIPSAHRLGLGHLEELLLYQFLHDIDLSPIPIIQWNVIPSVIKVQQSVTRFEKVFFQMINTFFQSRDYYNWRHLFDSNFFSKCRQTLVNRWVMGVFP